MTPRDLLARLKSEGLSVSLKLKVEGDAEPLTETLELLKRHRDDLITYLAHERPDTPAMCRLSEELADGAVWCSRCYRYHLQPCAPSSKRIEDVN